jgi:hypothetical protein
MTGSSPLDPRGKQTPSRSLSVSNSLHPELAQRLETHRRDYERVVGRPFQHFYCPILGADEPIVSPNALIRGHIVNKSIKGVSGTWVLQRSDVDNFYGTMFEADFETLQYRGKLSSIELLTNSTLAKKLGTMIRKDGKEVPFISQTASLPHVFTPVELGRGTGGPSIGIKMSHKELKEARGSQWEIAAFKDARIAALVSLLKAAHLTSFWLRGYRYATSPAGILIGHGLLGRFYRENSGLPRKQVKVNAWSFFREFAHAFRPVINAVVGYEGTISDRKVLACHGTSGRIWALIVLVRTGNQMHAVMIPAFDSVDSVDTVATYLDFMRNDNERIEVATAEFDVKNMRWTVYDDRTTQHWPKAGLLYPNGPEPVEYPFVDGRVALP